MSALRDAQANFAVEWQAWTAGRHDRLGALINAANLLAEQALADGQSEIGLQALTQVRRASRDAGSTNAELWALLNLIALMLSGADGAPADLDAAITYALQASQLAARRTGADPHGFAAPPDEAFAQQLGWLTGHVYYHREDSRLARQLAGGWLHWAPDDAAALRFLGLSAMTLLQDAELSAAEREALPREAERAWRALAAADPHNASAHANLAGALLAMDQAEAALAAVNRAIELAPEDLKYRDFRVSIYRAMDRPGDAIDDLGRLILMLEQRGAAQAPAEAGESQDISRRAYQRAPPLRDQLDFALFQRAMLCAGLGRREAALRDLERVERESDDATAALALLRKAELLEAAGDAADARAARLAAVGRNPADAQARLAAAGDAVRLAQVGEAIELVAPMSVHPEYAEAVMDLMQRVLDGAPDLPAAHSLRAVAADTALRCSIALDEYNWLLERDPDVAFLLYRRGKLLLTASIDPREAAWNDALSPLRIRDAINDLSRAATAQPAAADALPLLRWLIDRLAPTPLFVVPLIHLAEVGEPLDAACPGLRDLLVRLDEAVTWGNQRQYSRSVPALRQLKEDFLAQGWPVCAGHCDSYLADNLLRVFELQSALDHLESVRMLLQLINSPASGVLQEQAQSQRSESEQRGSSAFVLEQEYRLLYPLFSMELMISSELMRLDVLGRLGRREEFLDVLDRSPDLEAQPNPNYLQGFINLAARLRDNGEPARALELAERLVPMAQTRHQAALANLRGSLLHALDRKDESIEAYLQAMEFARSADPSRLRVVAANLAQLLIELDRLDEARELSMRELASLVGLSVIDRIGWHVLRARLAQEQGQLDEAWRQAMAAIRLTEGFGATLRAAEPRRTWYARFGAVFNLAIEFAILRDDSMQALSLVERTRARESLDRLASDVPVVPPAAVALVQARTAAQDRRRLLRQLDAEMQRYGIGYVDAARLAELQVLDPSLALTQTSVGGRRTMSPARLDEAISDVNAAIERLDQRMDAAVLAARTDALGQVLDAAQIGALLDD